MYQKHITMSHCVIMIKTNLELDVEVEPTRTPSFKHQKIGKLTLQRLQSYLVLCCCVLFLSMVHCFIEVTSRHREGVQHDMMTG